MNKYSVYRGWKLIGYIWGVDAFDAKARAIDRYGGTDLSVEEIDVD